MRWMLALALAAIISTRTVAQESSLADIRNDMSRADYRAARDKIDKLTFTLGQLPPSERYELFMAKGECELQLGNRLGAVAAFRTAAKNAADVAEVAAATANAIILDRAGLGKYSSPYAVAAAPIDILPPDSRKQAMRALQKDMWSRYQPQVDGALRAKSLPPIEQAFKPLSEMYFLEMTADGDARQTGAPMRDLASLAYRLVAEEIQRYADRIDQLDALSNSTADTGRSWSASRRGLWTPERNELKGIVAYLVKVRDRTIEYREIARGVKGDVQKWDTLVADASRAVNNAEMLWKARY